LKITVSKITLLCDLFARLSIRLSTTRSCRPLADWYSNATVLAGTGVQMFRPRKKNSPPQRCGLLAAPTNALHLI